MFHFFAKLGRKPWAKAVVPMIASTTTLGYLGLHMYAHNFVRNILAAQSSTGNREELSKNLQALIVHVFNEIKHDFNVPLIDSSILKNNNIPIKWFASSSADPITLGFSESKTGIMIGLPNYYNYEKKEDVPDNILEISKIRLFKSNNKESDVQEEKESDLMTTNSADNISKTRIDLNSPEAREYIESLLLSENAKKFSIAREIFSGDSYRPVAKTGLLLVSQMLSLFLSRAVVQKFRLADAHLSQRLTFYSIAALIGFGSYIFNADSLDRYYCQKADFRAININDSYRAGAVEYFTKLIQRNKSMRNMIEEMQFKYDEDGNHREAFFRQKYLPLQERLDLAQKERSDEK